MSWRYTYSTGHTHSLYDIKVWLSNYIAPVSYLMWLFAHVQTSIVTSFAWVKLHMLHIHTLNIKQLAHIWDPEHGDMFLCLFKTKYPYPKFNAGLFNSLKAVYWIGLYLYYKIEISAMYSYIPLGLNHLLNVGVDQWFHICIVDTCQWVYILVEGLFC